MFHKGLIYRHPGLADEDLFVADVLDRDVFGTRMSIYWLSRGTKVIVGGLDEILIDRTESREWRHIPDWDDPEIA